jgi:hypothetical protein
LGWHNATHATCCAAIISGARQDAHVRSPGPVTWHPALDVTRVVIGAQVVTVVLALVTRSILRRR